MTDAQIKALVARAAWRKKLEAAGYKVEDPDAPVPPPTAAPRDELAAAWDVWRAFSSMMP